MKILQIQYNNINNFKTGNYKTEVATNPVMSNGNPVTNIITNIYYKPLATTVFTGTAFEDNVVKQVEGKEFQGKGLYTGSRDRYIDFSKVGAAFLSQEPIDITTASDKEVYAYWHANALREGYECSWVRRYNPFNKSKPLANPHALMFRKNEDFFATNLKVLYDKNLCKSLDIPITDGDGNLSLDCVVFDTETTGTNIMSGQPKDWDKIIQIGALQVKDGKIIKDSAFNKLINPEMHIPEGATAVHGITDDMVKDKPTMTEVVAPFLNNYLNKQNGIVVAYNSKFDMTLLNNSIREYNKHDKDLKQKQMYKVLDPFILMLRIHPYLGAKKRLSEQYQFLFSKNMENAHDAFADVTGTVDVLKYTLYYLNEHRKDKTKPLTLRDVLIFQNGGTVPFYKNGKLVVNNNINIDLPLDMEGGSTLSNFKKSYIKVALCADNFFRGYQLKPEALNELAPEIGEKNLQKLKDDKIVGKLVDLNANGFPINPAETKKVPKTKGVENSFYVMKRNFKKVLEFALLEPYGEKSKAEIEELITEKAKLYNSEDSQLFWMKNPNPKDIEDGNDLPDLKIARKVMNENKN